jgi:tetratricopeptide (TPR) repeat protein
MPRSTRWRAAFGTAALLAFSAASAQVKPEVAANNSTLDAPLFYQLLIGEIELRSGEAGAAYQVILDAARRTRDETLFRRAVDVALHARAGDQALAASKAWRSAHPKSLDALRMQLQILSALNRMPEASEPLQALLTLTPAEERGGLIAALPRFMQRTADTRASAELIERVLKPYLAEPATRVQARVAIGRGWLGASESAKALELAHQAQRDDASAPGPMLLALDLMATKPEAESIVIAALKEPNADSALRLAYVRTLTNLQRYLEAVAQLKVVTEQKPELAPPYLSLGALYLELKKPVEGEAALLRYVDLAKKQKAPEKAPKAADKADDSEADDEEAAARPEQSVDHAWLLLAQAAEQRGDYKAAEAWLARVDDPQRVLDVQTRRASMLAKQGKVAEARELIRRVPETNPDESRSKLIAEAGVMREAKRWQEAFDVLGTAVTRNPEDTDLLYEQAMMAEKLDRVDEMERLLRRVIELKPEHAQAHNALGYSLADRRVRLPEARTLIQRALELSPGDPFITDSLGWVEYRLGNHDEALRLLRKAYATRPDPEIAAHLGEVLWSYGQREEARKVWTEAKGRDAANDVLKETLSRLKVGL